MKNVDLTMIVTVAIMQNYFNTTATQRQQNKGVGL